MKSSKIFLIAWLAVVGVLAFATVYILSQDAADTDGGDNAAQVPPRDVPGSEADGGKTTERQRTSTRKPRRLTQLVKGRVVTADGAPIVGAGMRVSLPVETAPTEETARMRDILFINDVIYLDIEDWDKPRPLGDWLTNRADRTSAKKGAQVIASGVSDDDGRFEIEIPRHIGGGPFRVTAEAPVGKASAQGVRPGIDVELTVGPVAAATGYVYSGDTNTGVADATVILDDGEMQFTGTTDAEGHFRIEGVAPGRYAVTAGAAGQPPLLGVIKQITTGEDLNIRLPRGTTLRVTAMFEPDEGDDRPLPGVDLVVLETDTYMYVMGRTDMNGVCEFKGLPPGVYSVNGRGERAVPFSEELVSVDGNELVEEVDLLFEPAIDTQLTIVDTSGKPVAGMKFYTANADDQYDVLRSQAIEGETDAQGRFTYAFEFDGPRMLIYGFKKGYSMVRAAPDGHDDQIPLTLVAHPAIRVHGTVRTPDGTPVPDAIVSIEVEPDDPDEIDDFEIIIRTRPDGTYDFPYVPRGEIWLEAELGDDAWSDDYDVELVEGTSEYRVDIELELD